MVLHQKHGVTFPSSPYIASPMNKQNSNGYGIGEQFSISSILCSREPETCTFSSQTLSRFLTLSWAHIPSVQLLFPLREPGIMVFYVLPQQGLAHLAGAR